MNARSPIALGSRFTRLTVIDIAPTYKSSRNDNIYRVKVLCDCNREFIVPEYKLRAKHTKSCGCLQIELAKKNLPLAKHHKTKTPEYRAWQGMRARCNYKKAPNFKDYGGRGITICEQWNNFENFLKDMGERPDKHFSLERKDVNKGYDPENCIWADWFAQSRNRRNNIKIKLNEQVICVSEACDILGTHQQKIYRMVRRFNITHQKAVDIFSSYPRNFTFRDYQKILDKENSISKMNIGNHSQG